MTQNFASSIPSFFESLLYKLTQEHIYFHQEYSWRHISQGGKEMHKINSLEIRSLQKKPEVFTGKISLDGVILKKDVHHHSRNGKLFIFVPAISLAQQQK